MTLQKFLANVFIIALMVACSVLSNIYGWGLTPHSWGWIIGVGFFVMVFLRIVGDQLK